MILGSFGGALRRVGGIPGFRAACLFVGADSRHKDGERGREKKR